MNQILEQNKICKSYSQGKSSLRVAEEYNCSKFKVLRILKLRGIQRRSISEAQRKYSLDHFFFSKIDSEKKAYWLGFIFADGCISKLPRAVLQIYLQKRDKSHLEKLRTDLKSNYPFRWDRNGYPGFCPCSKQLIKDLMKHGCTHNKTYNLEYPQIPDGLQSHFIRGYFDGDGSICKFVFSLGGTIQFLQSAQKVLMRNCNLTKTRLKIGNSGTGKLAYGGRFQVSRIHQFLYQRATTYLERKKSKFESSIFDDREINPPKSIICIDCGKERKIQSRWFNKVFRCKDCQSKFQRESKQEYDEIYRKTNKEQIAKTKRRCYEKRRSYYLEKAKKYREE